MKRLFFIYLFIASVAITNAQTTILGTIQSGGIPRTYRLYVPAIYSAGTPCPLILNLHGYTMSASLEQSYTNFKPIADTANFLMVYPQGTTDNNGNTFWNAGINNGLVDDIGFLSNLIDTLKSQYNIDLDRVYSTGFSMGGFMSHILAIALNNRIAAVASVAGTFFTYQYPYSPTKAMPVMQIHGTADATVPYIGASDMVPVDTTVQFWVKRNHCDVLPVFTNVSNTNTTDGCTAEHYVYNNGDNGTTVEFYKIISGAHTWPSAAANWGVTNKDFSASKEIWRFFCQYSLNSTSVKKAEKLSDNKIYLYPNPTAEKLTISFENSTYKSADVIVIDNFGKKVLSQSYVNMLTATLDLASLTSGVYFVQVMLDKKNRNTKKIVIER